MYQYHTLSNGIRVVFRRNASKVVYSGVHINVGSRDESPAQEGIAHFIEHSIFKGTTNRRSYHILNRIDGVGGELDAFTTKEETCIYASALTEHLERCLELFSDIIFRSTFPANELEREKEVVLEEIDSYKDSPADLIYDDFEELAFAGHPLAHNILGPKKNVRRFTSKHLHEFFRDNYTTQRMVISVVGDVDFKKVVRLCEKYFGAEESRPSKVLRSEKPVYKPFRHTANRHTHQVHMVIGGQAPDTFADQKVAFTLLNNILGGPAMNSRLNVAVRERYGFCYTIESQYAPFSDAGLFYIYAGVDADAQEKTSELILAELKRFCDVPLTTTQLRAAQRQLMGQLAISNDNALNEMQSIGKSYLVFDKVDTLEEIHRDILSVTPQQILEAARQCYDPERLSFLIYK